MAREGPVSLEDSSTMMGLEIILRSCGFCVPGSLPNTGKVSSWFQEHGCHQGSFQQLWGDGLHLLPMYIPGRDQTQGEQGWQLRGELPWKRDE